VIYGDPATPTSESLAIAELASHSSGEGASDSGGLGLDSILGCYRLRQGASTYRKPGPRGILRVTMFPEAIRDLQQGRRQ
jgi:hypothetical protein